jgi:hypothetical protein
LFNEAFAFRANDASLHAFNVWSNGRVEIPFTFFGLGDAPFDRDRGLRDELRRRLNEAVPDARIPGEDKRPNPSFALSALRDDATRQGFYGAIEWAFDEVVAAQVETV